MPSSLSAIRRFFSFVRPSDSGCWEWSGARDADGYGRFRYDGEMRRAHRVAYLLFVADAGAEHVLHHCDNPPCVNPAHLYAGNDSDNIRDMMERGRDNFARGEDSGAAKLTWEQVRTIRLLADQGHSYVSIAQRFGVTGANVSSIVRRLTWKEGVG